MKYLKPSIDVLAFAQFAIRGLPKQSGQVDSSGMQDFITVAAYEADE